MINISFISYTHEWKLFEVDVRLHCTALAVLKYSLWSEQVEIAAQANKMAMSVTSVLWNNCSYFCINKSFNQYVQKLFPKF